jgi:coiled-coil domain-containing protein 103
MPNKEIDIDFNKLENEVRKAVNADEKYWRENGAKLRAVEQRVPTYEDFRQMVLASHLKPLDKGETLSKLQNKSNWNVLASSDKVSLNSTQLNPQQIDLSKQKVMTHLEFMQLWNKIPKIDLKQKWILIKSVGENLKDLFTVEINGEMLGQFLILFNKQENEKLLEDSEFILSLLSHFPNCKRFELNMLFLGKNEIESCKSLFDRLAQIFSNEDCKVQKIENLKKLYLK